MFKIDSQGFVATMVFSYVFVAAFAVFCHVVKAGISSQDMMNIFTTVIPSASSAVGLIWHRDALRSDNFSGYPSNPLKIVLALLIATQLLSCALIVCLAFQLFENPDLFRYAFTATEALVPLYLWPAARVARAS